MTSAGQCAQCQGRGSIEAPLHTMQVMQSVDGRIRLLLHERCIGTWTLRNHNFIRSDAASYPEDSSANLLLGVEQVPECESCESAAAGLFLDYNGAGEQTLHPHCGSCGFRVKPSSSKRLLALYDVGGQPSLSSAEYTELLEGLALGIEVGVGFGKLRQIIQKHIANLRRAGQHA